MAKETILIIEDDAHIVELLKHNLEQEGFLVLSGLTGKEGLLLARRRKPGLILLDLMLPETDGLEVCKILRRDDQTVDIPIVMLTAKSEEVDKIIGLELGADDYVTKPFSPRELAARVKAVLRRGRDRQKKHVLRAGGIELETDKHRVLVRKKPVELTLKEFELLRKLMEANGRVLSRETLLNQVWDYDRSIHIETRTVDMHIGQLRKKLKLEGSRIVTVTGVGYRFEKDEAK